MSEMLLVLGNKNYSSWSLRPWLAMRHGGIAFAQKVVPLDFPSDNSHLLEFSPSKRVPVLVHGGLRIWDSMAILEYIAELFPGKKLWPEDRKTRAHARAVAMEMHAGLADLRNTLHMNMHRKPAPLEYGEAVARDIARIEQIWRDCREKHGAGGEFLFGGFCIADAMFAPVVSRFHTYEVQVGDVSARYMQTIRALPAWQEWEADAMKEEWVIDYAEV